MGYDLVIKNGTVVNSNGTFSADIGIVAGKIKTLQDHIHTEGERVLEAKNKYIFPGIIDVHTHLEHGSGDDVTVDDFESGSKAAAAGGITTFMDFIIQNHQRSIEESFQLRNQSAQNKSVIDYSFHIALMDVNQDILQEIPWAILNISSSFKLFLTYRKLGFMVNDDTLLQVMDTVAHNGGIIGVHGENDAMIEFLTDKYMKKKTNSPLYHARSRPDIAEAEAIHRVIQFSRITSCPVYIFHLSTKKALDIVLQARYEGLNIFVETNPHYLLLNEKVYQQEDGQNYIMSPPLRTEEDNEALWNGIRAGGIQVLSTDHCPYHKRHKEGGQRDFTAVSPGIPGIELLLPLIYSQGVLTERISLEKMVELLSSRPAEIFGLTPEKGSISIGSHADLVIFDPHKTWSVDSGNLLMTSDYSPYDGFTITGQVETTICRGEMVYGEKKTRGLPGFGRYLYR